MTTGSTSSTTSSEEEEWYLYATLQSNDDDDDANNSSSDPIIKRTIRSVAFAPTPTHTRSILAAASFDGSISIWEDFSNEQPPQPDGNTKYEDDDDNTSAGWERTAQLEGHESEVKDVAWNETGTLLASCGRDKTVWIWEAFLPGTVGGDAEGGENHGGDLECECLAVLEGHTQDVKCVAFASSHGQWGDGDEILLSASYDDTIRCWAEDAGEWYCALTLSSQTTTSPNSSTPSAAVHSSTIWAIALAPGGVRMISGSADESLAVWRCYTASEINATREAGGGGNSRDGTWKCVRKIPSAHKLSVYSVDCAPSIAGHGRIASSGADDCIHIFREEVGGGRTPHAPTFTLEVSAKMAHSGDVNCVRWHPRDGNRLASVGDDGLVKIWRYKVF